MKHPGPVYPGLHSEKKTHSNYMFNILYLHHLVTMDITIKTFIIIYKYIKKYVIVDNIPTHLSTAESHMYPSQQPCGFSSVLYIESTCSLKLQKL